MECSVNSKKIDELHSYLITKGHVSVFGLLEILTDFQRTEGMEDAMLSRDHVHILLRLMGRESFTIDKLFSMILLLLSN